MTLYASNFSSNALSGTVTVYGGAANINLGTATPFYLEGQKSFVVRLRKNSVDGPSIGVTTPITIPDRSSIVSLEANVSTVAEGNLVQYTIVTANVAANTVMYYETASLTGTVNSADFVGGNTGTVLISNNQGTFTIRPSADLSLVDETGERYKINLRSRSASGNLVYSAANAVTIIDVSRDFTVNSITPNITVAIDSAIVNLAIATTNANNTPVYYSIAGTGSLLTSECLGPTSGVFTPTSYSNVYTVTIKTAGNIAVDPRNFKMQIWQNAIGSGLKYTSANVFILAAPINASGGSVETTATYKIHAFTSPGTLTINSAPAGLKAVDYLMIGGGGGGGSVNAGYLAENAGGGGGVLMGNIVVYSGNTFSAVIGAGGSAGTHGSAFTIGSSSSGSNTTLSNPGYTWIAYNGAGGNGPAGGGAGAGQPATGSLSYGSPGFGVKGTQGWPGMSGAAGSGGGAGAAVNAPSSARGGEGISWDAPVNYGTTGSDAYRWFGGGGAGREPYNAATPTANIQGGYGGGGPTVFAGPWGGYVSVPGQNGNVNTGGGGAAGSYSGGVNSGEPGGAGGSGIVLIRYPLGAGGFNYTP